MMWIFLFFPFVLWGQPSLRSGQILHEWNTVLTEVILQDGFTPPVASRIYVYPNVAAYEALVAFNKEWVSLAGQLKGLSGLPVPSAGVNYHPGIVAAVAFAETAKELVWRDYLIDELKTAHLNTLRKETPDTTTYRASIVYGKQIAQAIMDWAKKDNYNQSRTYPKVIGYNEPGQWVPTSPTYGPAVEPHWHTIRTMVLDSASQFNPGPPIPFSTDPNSEFYKANLALYQLSKKLTRKQKLIASFWDCNPQVSMQRGHLMMLRRQISPGGHWILITQTACKKKKLSLMESAEVYAMVSIGLFEGFISCWQEKYNSKLLRPETYITQYIDPNWQPLLETPLFPEHTSGHSVISNASAVILTHFFGKKFSYVDSTEMFLGLPPRKFKSFLQAAEEAGMSRHYGGIHYLPAIKLGMKQGRNVAYYILSKIKTRKEEQNSSNNKTSASLLPVEKK
ncbi:MAG: vanadium-dependent haloperoxidase [Bacteroidia bacterium]|nr:vanadium-dependent haloperoxidase [Bacteroidia bacterium]MDW8159195.1 vanadium-dependent haloperoxidase [Bacteroidia bacterium]